MGNMSLVEEGKELVEMCRIFFNFTRENKHDEMKKIVTLSFAIILSTGSFGQLTYTKVVYDSVFRPHANSVVRTNDNGYMIAGDDGNARGLSLKVDSSGNLQWNKLIGH